MGKAGILGIAHKMFDEVPNRETLSWSALIASHSKSGDPSAAMEAYKEMRRQNVKANFVTILGLLSGIGEVIQVRSIHSTSIKGGFLMDVMVQNSMINIYLRCEDFMSARSMFDEMPKRDLVSWNTMISGFSRLGLIRDSFSLYKKMKLSSGLAPDRRIFSSLLSCCAGTQLHHDYHAVGKAIHAQIIVSGIMMDDQLETSMMGMYLKHKNHSYGIRLCDLSIEKDSVFWSSMISGMVCNDRADEAIRVFSRKVTSLSRILVSPVIASLLSACAQLSSFKLGASIHGYVLRRDMHLDLAAQNSLLSMYAKCGRTHLSLLLFSLMENRDVASWNSMISSFVHEGDLCMAMDATTRMMIDGFCPDDITLILLIKGSASLGSLRHGRILHGFIMRSNQDFLHLVSLSTALVDMYCKCGELELAQRCFDLVILEERDMVLWSAMISGYGVHGKGEEALELFNSFLASGIRPNKIIFLAALMACSHAGLVHDGMKIFALMREEMKDVEHYACVVDMLGKKGMLQEAAEVAARGRSSPEVLGILLDACRMHGDTKLGEEVAREIMALKPDGAASYVQMVHGFAAASSWDGVESSWRRMKELGLKKTPGWSSVDVFGGNIATFFMGQTSHPCHEELAFLLRILYHEMGIKDYDDDIENDYGEYDSNVLA